MALEKTYVAIDLEPERLELGTSSPLHMTVTPPVKIEELQAELIECRLRENLRDMAGFILRATEEDYFGPDSEPVRVRRFERTPQLVELHERALAAVQSVIPDVDTTYAGENYNPHSTYKGDKGVEEDEMSEVRQVTILRKNNGAWERAAVIPLKGE